MDNEMRKMQQEAIHRVNEMQNRAKQHLREEPEPAPAEKPPLPAEESSSVPAHICQRWLQFGTAAGGG